VDLIVQGVFRLIARQVSGRHQIPVIYAVTLTGCPRERPDARHVGRGGRAAGTTRQGLIGRHLVAALDCAVGKQVTIISAPAGSGQTSLLDAWADWPGQDRRITITGIR
jgi:LuxR family transcriptional regulator, maltose regulon positive regulatory protein